MYKKILTSWEKNSISYTDLIVILKKYHYKLLILPMILLFISLPFVLKKNPRWEGKIVYRVGKINILPTDTIAERNRKYIETLGDTVDRLKRPDFFPGVIEQLNLKEQFKIYNDTLSAEYMAPDYIAILVKGSPKDLTLTILQKTAQMLLAEHEKLYDKKYEAFLKKGIPDLGITYRSAITDQISFIEVLTAKKKYLLLFCFFMIGFIISLLAAHIHYHTYKEKL